MAKRLRFYFEVCVALMASGLSFVPGWVVPASAANAPYADPYASGVIGFCNQNNEPITHGKITDEPFVWLAVSSVPAAAGYSGPGETATLYAYQPIQGEDPGLWSGDQLTAASYYTNAAHPMVEASIDAETLQQFLSTFPLSWDNLVELRIYVGLPGQGIHNDTYPATDIQVNGDTWSVVHGGNVSCTAGYAVSSMNGDPPNSAATESPGTAPTNTSASPSGASSKSNGRSGGPGATTDAGASGALSAAHSTPSGPARGPGSPAAGPSQAASGPSSGSGGGSSSAVAVVLGAVILLLAGFLVIRARKNRSANHGPESPKS